MLTYTNVEMKSCTVMCESKKYNTKCTFSLNISYERAGSKEEIRLS